MIRELNGRFRFLMTDKNSVNMYRENCIYEIEMIR